MAHVVDVMAKGSNNRRVIRPVVTNGRLNASRHTAAHTNSCSNAQNASRCETAYANAQHPKSRRTRINSNQFHHRRSGVTPRVTSSKVSAQVPVPRSMTS